MNADRDSNGNVEKIDYNNGGIETKFEYENGERIHKIGQSNTFHYDENGRLIRKNRYQFTYYSRVHKNESKLNFYAQSRIALV